MIQTFTVLLDPPFAPADLLPPELLPQAASASAAAVIRATSVHLLILTRTPPSHARARGSIALPCCSQRHLLLFTRWRRAPFTAGWVSISARVHRTLG